MLLRISHFDPTGGLAYRWPAFDFARCVVEFCFGMLVFRAYAGGSWLKAFGRDGWTWSMAGLTVLALVGRSDLLAACVFPFLGVGIRAQSRPRGPGPVASGGCTTWARSRSRST